MKYTKRVKVVWNTVPQDTEPSDLIQDITKKQLFIDKMASMVAQDKTDGVYVQVPTSLPGNRRYRVFVDEAAALEYVEFLEANFADFTYTIVDNT